MKRKHLYMASAALLAAGGLWLGQSDRPANSSEASSESKRDTAAHTLEGKANSSQARQLAPPDQIQKFRDFTPEQRVEFARKGHGPGG